MKGESYCQWCAYTDWSCSKTHATCDFKTLPMERNAIMQRIKEEYAWIKEHRDDLKAGKYDDNQAGQKVLTEVTDKANGIKVMVEVLRRKFNVSLEEVRQETGFGTLSMMDSIRLAMKLDQLKNARKSK